MKEHPILFSGPMVRATLAGTKTQTRRVVKGQPRLIDDPIPATLRVYTRQALNGFKARKRRDGWWIEGDTAGSCVGACPYGQPGDRLWVRETHAIVPASAYRMSHDDGAPVPHQTSPDDSEWSVFREGWCRSAPSWKPSIHMPRWASRITLEITDVRVERLQAISEADILAEGVTVNRVAEWCQFPWSSMPTLHHAWRAWWDSLNAKRGLGWDANPWVWVLTFRRLPCHR